MISVIGLGGAGGNIADVAGNHNILTGAVNFSQKDLDSLDNVKHKLKIPHSEGVGKNRDLAKELIHNNWELVVDFVHQNFNLPSIEVIFLAFSSSGGSGSGISPLLLELLSNTFDKTFVAIPIIPDQDEVITNQVNCLQTFEELSSVNSLILPIDNNKFINSGLGKSELYKQTNEQAIELILNVCSYTEKHSKNGNFDKKDFLTITNTKGIGTIGMVDIAHLAEQNDLTSQGIANAIKKSWDKSVFTSIEFQQVVRAGVIADVQESVLKWLNASEIFSSFENGLPIDLFEGNYHESNGIVLTFLSGLSWCNSRLHEIENLIKQNEERIDSILNTNDNQGYKSKVNTSLLNNFRNKNKNTLQKKESPSEILAKFKR